jgi:hypothetical protein
VQRKIHYWNWFIIYGVANTLIGFQNKGQFVFNSEMIWVILVGLIGVISISKPYNERIARPFDIIVGFFFASVGIFGILHNLGLYFYGSGIFTQSIHDQSFLGLSLCPFPSLIHASFGIVSISHGFYVPPPKPTVAIGND